MEVFRVSVSESLSTNNVITVIIKQQEDLSEGVWDTGMQSHVY
jgi:hypothetical protein